MMQLASEGGYQAFHLSGGDKVWLVLALVAGLVGIAVGLVLIRGVLAADQGTPSIREIAGAIQEGALAFLRRQFRVIVVIVVPLAVLIFFTATKVVKTGPLGFPVVADGHEVLALSFWQAGIYRVICFLAGAACSGLTGFIGMSLAVRGNVRTAAAARGGTMPGALRVAFRTGAITGMLCVGLGLLGATTIVFIFQNYATAVLVGFAFGASLLALFMRVGGGIFTKAADVGADLVGKVEAGIPEDDPRNAATIADNVGDNVGDCAGMAADLFESYVITIISSLILGYAAFRTIHSNPAPAVIFPLIIPAFGIVASVIGVYLVRALGRDRTAMAPINRGYWSAAFLTVVAALLVAQFYVHNLKLFWAVFTGVVLSLALSQITEHFTSTERNPVREIAEAARTGPATTVLSGIAIGLESSVWAIIAIAIAIGVAVGLGDGNIEYSLYLVALIGIGLLATTGMIVSEDSFGPVSDNAAGIAEMSGEFTGDAERVMVSLDAVGNTTKAITKGVAIGSAVIASVALFASFIETTGSQLGLRATGVKLFQNLATQINLANPTTFCGLLIGGSVVFLFSSLAIRAVGRSAGTVVQEVRRQFREHPGHHGLQREARVRTGHLDLHRGRPAGARHAGPARHPVAGHRRLRDQLPGPGRVPGRRHPDRPAHGQQPVQLGWSMGQREEVHRGRPRGRQGLRGAQGGRDRRHGRGPLQGHRRTRHQPPDQGDEPGGPADPAGRHHASQQQRCPVHDRGRRTGHPAGRGGLFQAQVRGVGRRRRRGEPNGPDPTRAGHPCGGR